MTRSMRNSRQGIEYNGRVLSENLRDLDARGRYGLRVRERTFKAFYTEPMWVGESLTRPRAILLGNITAENSPETVISGVGSLVQFLWDGDKGARVLKIQGLTPTLTTQYEFTFLFFFRSER